MEIQGSVLPTLIARTGKLASMEKGIASLDNVLHSLYNVNEFGVQGPWEQTNNALNNSTLKALLLDIAERITLAIT